jgi:hypothetical protein
MAERRVGERDRPGSRLFTLAPIAPIIRGVKGSVRVLALLPAVTGALLVCLLIRAAIEPRAFEPAGELEPLESEPDIIYQLVCPIDGHRDEQEWAELPPDDDPAWLCLNHDDPVRRRPQRA